MKRVLGVLGSPIVLVVRVIGALVTLVATAQVFFGVTGIGLVALAPAVLVLSLAIGMGAVFGWELDEKARVITLVASWGACLLAFPVIAIVWGRIAREPWQRPRSLGIRLRPSPPSFRLPWRRESWQRPRGVRRWHK